MNMSEGSRPSIGVPVVRVTAPPMHFHLKPAGEAWSLSEESGMIAGVFTTAEAALDFARKESLHAPGSNAVIESGAEAEGVVLLQ